MLVVEIQFPEVFRVVEGAIFPRLPDGLTVKVVSDAESFLFTAHQYISPATREPVPDRLESVTTAEAE